MGRRRRVGTAGRGPVMVMVRGRAMVRARVTATPLASGQRKRANLPKVRRVRGNVVRLAPPPGGKGPYGEDPGRSAVCPQMINHPDPTRDGRGGGAGAVLFTSHSSADVRAPEQFNPIGKQRIE
eukprot:scaffold10094_cov53-Phaeocystis_antarctica.AAC.1